MEVGFTPDGLRVYAALAESDEVIAIDPTTREIVARVSTGSRTFPWRVRLSPSGAELWVSLRHSGEVIVLDIAAGYHEIARISGFDEPADIAFVLPAAPLPTVTAALTPVEGKSLKHNKGTFTVEYSCQDGTVTSALLNDVEVEDGDVARLSVKSEKSQKSGKSEKSKKSGKSGKSAKSLKLTAPSFELTVVCENESGTSVATATPEFPEKSTKDKED